MLKLIAGNWKMHGLAHDATELARAVKEGVSGVELVVCPPFVHIPIVAATLAGSPVALGGQDCHAAVSGAYTGDVSAAMLRDAGCRFVILGHSERRRAHAETDALVRAKAAAAAAAGLTPIICVGESDEERRSGRKVEIVASELAASLPPDFAGVLAYEPVWAIGTGDTPSGEDIMAMHRMIREQLVRRFGARGGAVRILYGGSVSRKNAAEVVTLPEVDGALVGGASLTGADFLAIAAAASEAARPPAGRRGPTA